MKIAVALTSFDRFHLVKHALLRVMRFLPRTWSLRVFQDGWVDSLNVTVGSPERVRRALDLFGVLSVGVDSHGERNRGVAEIVYAAEVWAFEQERADCLILIEDDIVISRFFFAMMKTLARFALNNDRVGAFSAFGDSQLTLKQQFLERNNYIPMHHRWGHGMTRDFWLRGRDDYVRYLDLMKGIPYRLRPHDKIHEFLSGFRNSENLAHITSQDAAHTAIMLHHDGFAFMPPTSYAINIGKAGLHFRPEFYRQHLGQMRGPHFFFPAPVPLSESRLRAQSQTLFEQSSRHDYW